MTAREPREALRRELMKRSIGEKIVGRLAAFASALEKNEAISERFTCRTVELQLEPQPYNPKLIRSTRQALGMSQALFAQFLGVSTKLVAAWEQGARTPNDMACRFMDEIRHNPTYWRNRLKNMSAPKSMA
jgi:putative transcriptional regulator